MRFVGMAISVFFVNITLLVVSPSWAQVASTFVPIPEPDLAACVDTEPLGDGFGWNGTCGCNVGTAHGAQPISFKNDLIVFFSSDTPSGCNGSGSLFAVSRQMGEWKVEAELNSSNRAAHDDFPHVLPLGRGVDASGNTIIASTSNGQQNDALNYLAIFESDDGINWFEKQAILGADSNAFLDFEDPVIEGNTLAYWSNFQIANSNDRSTTLHVFEKLENGFWEEAESINFGNLAGQGNIRRLTITDASIGVFLVDGGLPQIRIYDKQGDMWSQGARIDLPLDAANSAFFEINENIIVLDRYTLNKNIDGSWSIFETNEFSGVGALNGQQVASFSIFSDRALSSKGALSAVFRNLAIDDAGRDCEQSGEVCTSHIPVLETHNFSDGRWSRVDRITLDFADNGGVPVAASSGQMRYGENELLVWQGTTRSWLPRIYSVDDNGIFVRTNTEESGLGEEQNTESCDNCDDEGIAGTGSQESDSESNETALNPDDELDADNTDTNSDGSSSVVNQNNDVGQSSDGINAVTSTQATDESGGGPIGLEGLIVFLFALRRRTTKSADSHSNRETEA